MPRPDADRNLLFGILAVQMDFLSKDGLVAGMNGWVLAKHRPLGEILVEQGSLRPAVREALEGMVDLHIAEHGNDASASLLALGSVVELTTDLHRSIDDEEVRESLASLAPADFDSDATQIPQTADLSQTGSGGAGDLSFVGPRFRKVRDHAKGGLGVVFVARDEELRRDVALKEIQDRHADDLDKRARFLMEAEITGGLEHPGIVPVYALGHYQDGRPYYAMRFIKGDSLKEAIGRFHADPTLKDDPGRRTLALQKLLRRFLDVCNAVAYAHSRGVLHRDLKPDNVMVGRYGETLVVDWGLAKAAGRSGDDEVDQAPGSTMIYPSGGGSAETLPGSVIGTPAYMSPEQATGRLDLLGPGSDVYSLGATLYSLLTGRIPFNDKDIREILRKVEHGEFKHPREVAPWLDPALEAICLKAMALEPESRYAGSQILAEDLERWLADEPVTAYREPWTRRAGRWARKHRTALAATTTAAAVSALLLGGVAWVRYEQRQRTDASAQLTLREAENLAIGARESGDLTRWDQAIAEALRAQERLESGGGSGKLRQAVEARLSGFRNEQALRREALESEKKDRQVVADLGEARLLGASEKDGYFDSDAKIDAYIATFQAYGIDLATLPVEESARRIQSSKVADDLVTALDDWVEMEPTKLPRSRLEAIARAADTEPVHEVIRDAVARKDPDRLRQLIARPEDRVRIGTRLRTVFQSLILLDPTKSLPLLETIRAEYPADFWINHDLGKAYLNAKPRRIEEAVLCLSVAVALRPNSPGAHLNLGAALHRQGKIDRAIESYRKSIAIQQPGNALVYNNLGSALHLQGKMDEAVAAYQKSIQLKPDNAEAHYNLGSTWQEQGKLEQAIESYQKAIQFKPDLGEAHTHLGNAWKAQGKFDQAVKAYREASRVRPDLFEARINLGLLLQDLGQFDQAIEAFREALRIEPEHAMAYSSLGNALQASKKFDQAVEAYRKAIAIQPDHAASYSNLGNTLKLQGKVDEAIEAYRKAIALQPELAEAHVNLGLALRTQGKFDQAIEAYRAAIRCRPQFAGAHYNLGTVLQVQGKLEQALEAYQAAIRFEPGYAEAYCNLGLVLGSLGRFQEAVEFLEKGHARGTQQPGWPYPSRQWIAMHRRFLELEQKIPAILKDEVKPADVSERLELAVVCQRKGLHASSARFADEAFAEKPELSGNLQNGLRYNAACSASLAGSGQSKDDPMPDEAARTRLREQARNWLKADLVIWEKVLEAGEEPARKRFVASNLAHWKEDPDLVGIRDEAALTKRPEAEREALRQLWAEVDRLLVRARQAPADQK